MGLSLKYFNPVCPKYYPTINVKTELSGIPSCHVFKIRQHVSLWTSSTPVPSSHVQPGACVPGSSGLHHHGPDAVLYLSDGPSVLTGLWLLSGTHTSSLRWGRVRRWDPVGFYNFHSFQVLYIWGGD